MSIYSTSKLPVIFVYQEAIAKIWLSSKGLSYLIMEERLQKILSQWGIASCRAEAMILAVWCNGTVVGWQKLILYVIE